MTTQVDIANRALAQIGTRSQLTGSTINSAESAEALYASLLYNPLLNFLLTEGDYDFAMAIQGTVASLQVDPWPFAYVYPVQALRVRQLLNATPTLDPRPFQWNIVNFGAAKRIVSMQAANRIIITIVPIEDLWDSIFTEAYTRLLASALAFATENRIEASKEKLAEAISFAGIANLRDE